MPQRGINRKFHLAGEGEGDGQKNNLKERGRTGEMF